MQSSEPDPPLCCTETAAGVTFTLHVQPRASRNELCGVHNGELKIRLTAPPVDDAANRLCVEFIARELGVAKARVTLVGGAKSRHKVIKVAGISITELNQLLKYPAAPSEKV